MTGDRCQPAINGIIAAHRVFVTRAYGPRDGCNDTRPSAGCAPHVRRLCRGPRDLGHAAWTVVATGAIGSMVTNAVDPNADHSIGGYLKAAGIGAIGGLAGYAGGALVGAAIKIAAPAIGQAIKAGTAALGRAGPAVVQAAKAVGEFTPNPNYRPA
jgi:hypothetical protein